jgi:hypothetical protein
MSLSNLSKYEIYIYDDDLKDVIIDKNTVYCYFDDDSSKCLKIQKQYFGNNIDVTYGGGFYDEFFDFDGIKEIIGNELISKIEEKIAEKYKKNLKLKDIIMKGVK